MAELPEALVAEEPDRRAHRFCRPPEPRRRAVRRRPPHSNQAATHKNAQCPDRPVALASAPLDQHSVGVSLRSLVEWTKNELTQSGLSSDEASTAAGHIPARSNSMLAAATMVSTARAIGRLPEGSRWWASSEAVRAKERLLGGEADYAWTAVAERLAEPAEDCWDPNWPSHKAASVLVRPGAVAGDAYVVGNGEGQRARVEVVERGGTFQAVITESWFAFDDLWDDAVQQAEAELRAGD